MIDPHSDRMIYAPINTLKPVAEDVWIVDGPLIGFGLPGFKLPYSTRMTIVRLPDGRLFIHSPTPLVPSLRSEIEAIGAPSFIIGPNRIHYWWIPEWHATYPEATVYLAPRIEEQAGDRIDFNVSRLDRTSGYPWDATIDMLSIACRYMTELEFFHRPSRTLIVTDLMGNFEPSRLPSAWLRWLMRAVGVTAPNGGMGFDMRLVFWSRRKELRSAVKAMIDWQPERIILAHGQWFESDAVDELRRAFRWLLGNGSH